MLMKKLVGIIMVVVICFVLSGSTVFAALFEENPSFSGFLGTPSVYKQLKPGPEGGAKLRWIEPGTDFRKYNKFMVDSVIFYLADESENKGIDPQAIIDLADSFNKELVAAFKDKYEIVAEPGPDVARIRLAITNIKQSKPVISAVTSIVPIGLAVNVVKKGVTGGWTGGGETGVELQVLDSTTNYIILMAADKQQAAFVSRFSKLGSANDAFKFWSERIVKFVDDVKGIKRKNLMEQILSSRVL
jgi:hypothetical protein